MEILINTIRLLSIYSPVIFLLLLFVRRKSHFLLIDKIIIAIVLISFSTDMTLAYFNSGHNYIHLFIYALIDTLLLLYFYHKLLVRKSILIPIMILVLLLTLISELFFKNPLDELFTIYLTIKCLVFLILSLSYFYQVYTKDADIFKSEAPQFCYNVGILIYFSLAFFPFFLATEVLSDAFDLTLWQVHNIGNILKNIIFALGLWMVQKR